MSYRRLFANLVLPAILAVVYFGAAKLGLALAIVNVSATAVWPPTGIALAALLVLGKRVWPGILLGAFLANATTAGSVTTSLAIALGNTLEALIGAHLINRFAHGRHVFDRTRDIFTFVILAAIMSTAVSATVGVSILCLGGFADWANYGPIWLTWWLGDAVGALVVTAPLVLWSMHPRLRWSLKQALEVALLLLVIILVGLAVFGGLLPLGIRRYPITFICLPPLIWAALRFGPREAATAACILSGIAIWGTVNGFGPFVTVGANDALLVLQAFIAVAAVTSLILAAAVWERKRAEEALRQAKAELKARVAERTAELSAANQRLQQELGERARAEEQLRTSEERFRVTFHAAPTAQIITRATDGLIIDVNTAFAQLLSYPRAKLIGRCTTDLPIWLDLDRAQLIGELRSAGRLRERPTRVRTGMGTLRDLLVSMEPIQADGAPCFLSVMIDVTERNQAELALREQRDQYEVLLQGLSDLGEGVLVGEGEQLVYVNDAFCAMVGYTRAELLALESVTHLIAPILSSASAERLRRLRQGEEIGHFEGALRHKQGHSVPLNVASKMLHVGERPRYISVMHDITARQRAEVALRKSQARLAGILDIADDAIVAVNGRHEIELFNQGAERIFGYMAGEVIGQPLDMLLPASVAATHRQHIEVFAASADVARRMGERQDIFGRRRDGTEFPAEASISKLTAKDEPLFTVILRDITARKQIETRLRASVREKEILLQEVHHRVKNNLQIIQSLLRLQAYAVGDPALHELFRDSQNRVHAMALVHEQLYGAQDVAHVDCSAYLHELAVSVLRSYEVQSARIALTWAIDGALAVDINTAIPLGLIMTELVSNSLKHAFPAGRTGTITVGLHDDSASLVMTVRDDGIGLASIADARTTNSLGIQLVGDLTEQLGGTVRVDCQPGTAFQICIPHAPNLNKE